ncbi:MAG TPA: hypothetical protein PKC43_03680 [Phycisphaerales bacterium]|nr:hypothetical protein [Phycisphaerales bacterium]HMP36527.1 hypothetical protein [Phycisphaerales bacterium]
MFPVKRVDPDLAENLEPLGTKRKYWFREGETRLLFKAEERGTGEDWAEKIVCELAGLLGLPHVHYELAVEEGSGKPGVVCPSCAVKPYALVLGNQILLAIDRAYPATDGRKFKVKAHTVAAVADALASLIVPPLPWVDVLPREITTALGVFIGYIMLDAWTANQDRHHENWGVLWDGHALRLAPTFDHGAALARNLTDRERGDRLISRDPHRQLRTFATRARSALFDEVTASKPLSTIAAWRAFAERDPSAAEVWKARLSEIDAPTVHALVDQIPPHRMSPVCRKFTLALLEENRHRILSESPG